MPDRTTGITADLTTVCTCRLLQVQEIIVYRHFPAPATKTSKYRKGNYDFSFFLESWKRQPTRQDTGYGNPGTFFFACSYRGSSLQT